MRIFMLYTHAYAQKFDTLRAPTKQTPELSPTLQKLLETNPSDKASQEQIKLAFADGYAQAMIAGGDKKSESATKKNTALGTLVVRMFIIGFVIYILAERGVITRMLGNVAEVNVEDVNVTFDDVRGVQEAKDDLQVRGYICVWRCTRARCRRSCNIYAIRHDTRRWARDYQPVFCSSVNQVCARYTGII
jgi:hypothetical protein